MVCCLKFFSSRKPECLIEQRCLDWWLALKETCNIKTSWFHLKGRSKSCKMRPKSLKSAKPFLRYSALKIEIWTILWKKNDKKIENVVFYKFCKNWRTIDCVTSEIIDAHMNNNQSRIFPSVELIRAWNFMDE